MADVSLTSTPCPPLELANRVGSLADAQDAFAVYDEVGRKSKQSLVELLPDGYSFSDKRVLDFGCGAGRTLRHFVAEARICEFWGCDIDAPSIEWLEQSLSPPFRVLVNAEAPPLPLPPSSFDLVYAISIFTHLVDTWSSWLLELHRILTADGLLIATFMGEGSIGYISEESWDESSIGMNVLRPGQSWDLGGPMVLHSPWWIDAHWGRVFDVLDLRPHGFAEEPPSGQGMVLMRKREADASAADLERPQEGEPRELMAAQHNVDQLSRELVDLRSAHEQLAAAWRSSRSEREHAGTEPSSATLS